MNTATVDLAGLDRLTARFRLLVNPNAAPLMVTWEDILDDDNRKGVLLGTGGDGLPLAVVTYRPRYSRIGPLKKGVKSKTLTVAQRLGQKPNKKRGSYNTAGGLTTTEYRLLDGPPLAPRRQFSRVITNYRQTSSQSSPTTWEAVGFWDDVVSAKGLPFLHYHFDGIGQKRRDLRGLREWGRERARTTARNWMIAEIRK
jgi:hypothetical protein